MAQLRMCFKNYLSVYTCVYVFGHVHASAAHIWRPQENLQESFLSFLHVGTRDSKVIRLGSKCFHPLNHLTNPRMPGLYSGTKPDTLSRTHNLNFASWSFSALHVCSTIHDLRILSNDRNLQLQSCQEVNNWFSAIYFDTKLCLSIY